MTRHRRQRTARLAAREACHDTRRVLVRDGPNAPGFVIWYACFLARLARQRRQASHRWTRVDLPPSSRPGACAF